MTHRMQARLVASARRSNFRRLGSPLLRTSTASQGRQIKLCDALIGALDGTRADRHHYELTRQAGSDPEPLPLAPRVIAALAVVAPDVERLTFAPGLVEAAAAAVISNKWRGSYPLVARLVVALAHTSPVGDRQSG